MKTILVSIILLIFTTAELAQAQAPRVGRRAAAKYFQKDVEPDRDTEADSADSSTSYSLEKRLLMLHLGGYSQSSSFAWKDSTRRNGVGKATYGVTYLYDEWAGLDVNIRFDFNEYQIDEQRASKLSAMPLWTFPKAQTKFPLYFGAGLGAGIFFTQLSDESNIAFDYQLIVGARFQDLYENSGLFIEYGLKNHLHLLSDGQFNGTALSGGVVFTF